MKELMSGGPNVGPLGIIFFLIEGLLARFFTGGFLETFRILK